MYQRYRAAGQPGWCDAETLAENLRNLAMVIERLQPQPGSRFFGQVESILDDIREARFTIGHLQVETYPECVQDTLRVDCVKCMEGVGMR